MASDEDPPDETLLQVHHRREGNRFMDCQDRKSLRIIWRFWRLPLPQSERRPGGFRGWAPDRETDENIWHTIVPTHDMNFVAARQHMRMKAEDATAQRQIGTDGAGSS